MFLHRKLDASDFLGHAVPTGKNSGNKFTQIPEEQRARPHVPEKKLIVAVIVRGIRDYKAVFENPTRRPKRFQKTPENYADAWLFDDDESEPFSFRWCCRWLDLTEHQIQTLLDRIDSLTRRDLDTIFCETLLYPTD